MLLWVGLLNSEGEARTDGRHFRSLCFVEPPSTGIGPLFARALAKHPENAFVTFIVYGPRSWSIMLKMPVPARAGLAPVSATNDAKTNI
jgi:hypothetical protein